MPLSKVDSSIDESSITQPEDRAHYNLLMARTSLLVNKPAFSDSFLNSAIAYYKEVENMERLADAYYYKGYSTYMRKDALQAVTYYKKAEKLVASNNNELKYKIVEAISFINMINGKYDLALDYAKLALESARSIHKKKWVAEALYKLGVSYSNTGQLDSAFFFFRETEPYIKYLDEKQKPYFLGNLGLAYIDQYPLVAKKYLLESLSYKELASTMELLAEITYEEGNTEEAYRLWKRALRVDDINPKDNIIHNLLEYDIEHGKTDEVCERVNEIIAIKDSIINKVKNDTIRDLQIRFDHEVEMNKANKRLIHWQWVLGGVVFLLLCLTIYIVWKRHKAKLLQIEYEMRITRFSHQLLEQEVEITKAENQILELKSTDSQNQEKIRRLIQVKENAQKEIEEMEKKMEKWQGIESKKIRRGIKLYEDLVQNKTAQTWSTDDYEAFIMFYEVGHYNIVRQLRKQYDRITDRNMLYLILVDMGKTRDEIGHIMTIDTNSIRSIKHRLTHRKSED